jgi:hypothetical protein
MNGIFSHSIGMNQKRKVSRMKLNNKIQSQIQKDALQRLRKMKADKHTNLYLHDEVLAKGVTLKAVSLKVPIERETAFVFADLAPEYNWVHPCEYHLYDAKTGDLYKTVKASMPPSNIVPLRKSVTGFHMPVKLIDTKKRRATWKKRMKPIANALSNAPGERYAILFAGRADNRHTNDLEFLYRTLIDDYGFTAGNIHVLNHDGTLNYCGSPSPIGNWPGDNTAYRMVVTGPGTRAGFQVAFNAIAAVIRPEDMLFIHTNNHGGGPCDPGITDYCMFVYDPNCAFVPYYVNNFIADMGVLPQFEVLMVMMEQCRAGGFINPIINNSPATWTHFASAVVANDYSLGGANFDPFAEDWIAGIHGQYADGTGLAQVIDTNNDGRISAAEAFSYANAVRHFNGAVYNTCPTPGMATCQSCGGVGGHALRLGDSPIASDSPAGFGAYIFLGLPDHDLYLRDNLQDHGREPLINGGINCSPDIIVYNQELLDPEATLGTFAAQQSDTLGQKVEIGQDNFIYLRVQNRGTQPTSGTARVFWALPSILPTPASWTEITDPANPEAIPAINPEEMRIVGPIIWNKADIPGKGHYCFIGLINSGDDPALDITTIHTIDDYYNFIRASNNATWKNFDIDDVFANSVANIEFAIQGWPKIKLSADLMVDLTQIPEYMIVKLRILKRISSSAKTERATLVTESSLYQQFELVPGKQAFLWGMDLKPSDMCQASLEITIPETAKDGNYRLSVAQLVDGKVMGQVTRMLSVGVYPFLANRRTLEVHVPDCEWAAKTSRRNKVAYQSIEKALKHGYNGCAYCLREYNTG